MSRAYLFSVPLVVMLLSASFPSSALDRNDGDYWVYSMVVVVPGFGVSATGTVKYEFVSRGSLTIDGVGLPVNVMRVTGSAVGGVALIDLSAAVVIEGYIYEALEDMSTVRSDLTYWTNVSWGSGDFAWPINTANRSVSTYTPPLLSGFDTGTTAPGATWTENIEVRTGYYNMTTGLVEHESASSMTISYSVHSEHETVSTGAGRFETLRITATESSGGRVVYWWSEEIGLFVKEDTYAEGSAQPVQTLALEDYSGKPRTDVLVFVAVGGVAMAVALVALALVLIRRRPPRPDTAVSQPLELLPPPP
jgi:hypothetical protein